MPNSYLGLCLSHKNHSFISEYIVHSLIIFFKGYIFVPLKKLRAYLTIVRVEDDISEDLIGAYSSTSNSVSKV